MSNVSNGTRASSPQPDDRRGFLTAASTATMFGALAAAYGTLGAIMARFLYPSREQRTGWMYVTDTAGLAVGGSLIYRTPSGATVAVARRGNGKSADDFIALSSVCPHLGCQVHWEAQNNRFFCPCHNGVFDPTGKAVSGPPAEGKQSLSRYPLKVDGDLLFIQVPTDSIADGAGSGQIEAPCSPPGPGHDPCLYESPPCLNGSTRRDRDA